MHNFKELKVWSDSVDLTTEIYRLMDEIPKSQEFILKPQILRSAISVPSNIAEGCGRSSEKEFYHFLTISSGSLNELYTQMLIAKKASIVSAIDFVKIESMIINISKMLYKLQHTLAARIKNRNTK